MKVYTRDTLKTQKEYEMSMSAVTDFAWGRNGKYGNPLNRPVTMTEWDARNLVNMIVDAVNERSGERLLEYYRSFARMEAALEQEREISARKDVEIEALRSHVEMLNGLLQSMSTVANASAVRSIQSQVPAPSSYRPVLPDMPPLPPAWSQTPPPPPPQPSAPEPTG